MSPFALGGLLPEGLIVQNNIISTVLLPNFSICHNLLKNVVISNGERVVLKVADPRSLFYLGKTAGCPSKCSSAFQISNHDPWFLFLFPLSNHLSQEGILFHAIPCLIPHELCLFRVHILCSIFAFLFQHLNLYNLGLVMVSDGYNMSFMNGLDCACCVSLPHSECEEFQ